MNHALDVAIIFSGDAIKYQLSVTYDRVCMCSTFEVRNNIMQCVVYVCIVDSYVTITLVILVVVNVFMNNP